MPWRLRSSAIDALMFCPVCKAEYREGFRECSDCGVGLVRQLAVDSGAAAKFVGDPDAMEVLWAGVDANTSSSIVSAVDAAKIAYKEDSVESQLMPAFRQSIYRIEVRRGDLEAALKSIQDLGGGDELNLQALDTVHNRDLSWLDPFRANPSRLDRSSIGEPSPAQPNMDEPEAAPIAQHDFEQVEPARGAAEDDLLEDFFPEDATAEVWSGEDAEMGENIRMCLREVGINCDVRQENGKTRVFVLPQSETRAREIIREITEATAPE
ncbi:MAG: hypothetical protein WB780_11375 [Candidatus Acidiferrales bacterium]